MLINAACAGHFGSRRLLLHKRLATVTVRTPYALSLLKEGEVGASGNVDAVERRCQLLEPLARVPCWASDYCVSHSPANYHHAS